MKNICLFLAVLFAVLFALSAVSETNEELALQVRDTETAFAQTMAARDFDGFVSFLSEETVFFSGKDVLRGKTAVAAAWKPYFTGLDAPFFWGPEKVEVLDSGTLALSTGPIYTPDGKQSGTFSSIWRREADGKWKIIFDKGCPACDQGPINADDIKVKLPECYYKTVPIYPELARRARVKGVVVVQAVWDTNGRVTNARVVSSPGKQFGFDDAALTAIKKWKCNPATVSGNKVEVYGNVTVNFTMP